MANNITTIAKLIKATEPKKPVNILGLNDDCLRHIFEYLEIFEWLAVRATSKRFHDVIRDEVIARELVDFHIFQYKHSKHEIMVLIKLFGDKLTKIKFDGYSLQQNNPFQSFLMLLPSNRQVNRLEEMHFRFGSDRIVPPMNQSIINESAQYFDNLKVLNLIGWPLECLEQWLSTISGKKIQKLEIVTNAPDIPTINFKKFQSLQFLSMNTTFTMDELEASFDPLVECVQQMPSTMKSIRYRGNYSPQLLNAVSQFIPKIKKLLIKNSNGMNWNSLTKLKQLETFGTDLGNQYDIIEFTNLFRSLSSVSTLKNLKLRLFQDFANHEREILDLGLEKINLDVFWIDMPIANRSLNICGKLINSKVLVLTCTWLDVNVGHVSLLKKIIEQSERLEFLVIDCGAFVRTGRNIILGHYNELLETRKEVNTRSGEPKFLTIIFEDLLTNDFDNVENLDRNVIDLKDGSIYHKYGTLFDPMA